MEFTEKTHFFLIALDSMITGVGHYLRLTYCRFKYYKRRNEYAAAMKTGCLCPINKVFFLVVSFLLSVVIW